MFSVHSLLALAWVYWAVAQKKYDWFTWNVFVQSLNGPPLSQMFSKASSQMDPWNKSEIKQFRETFYVVCRVRKAWLVRPIAIIWLGLAEKQESRSPRSIFLFRGWGSLKPGNLPPKKGERQKNGNGDKMEERKEKESRASETGSFYLFSLFPSHPCGLPPSLLFTPSMFLF